LKEIKAILATDCGSTTSKARFFKKIGNEYRYVVSGEAPTTVESPYEDVTLGVRNAIREIEELTGHKLLSAEGIITPFNGENDGVDLYVTTSSAGGGLQMMVSGVIKTITAESAERAALGAGAIVMDVLSVDDGRRPFQKIQKIRQLRPDMILIAGGTDGGVVSHVVEAAELIVGAQPKARFGADYELPIVYAGNKDARSHIQKLLGEKFALLVVDNIRPELDVENNTPAREAVHALFMEHVMSHAPGYPNLMKWTDIPIMPTPAGEGAMFRTIAETWNVNVIGVGLGGATTNVYSNYDGKFVVTISANLGMSYSICNVLEAAGIQNISRWIPFKIDDATLRNSLRNKMIRPTTIPQTIDELAIEQAVAREALRLGFMHHKSLARELRGLHKEKFDLGFIGADESFLVRQSYIDPLRVDLIGGTGGLLSHAPRRVQSALILMDGFQPEGVTELVQDSVFMMPHLGVLSTVHKEAAIEIFEKDCLVRIGTCIAPKNPPEGELKAGEVVKVTVNMPNGTVLTEELKLGELKVIPLKTGETADVEVSPHKKFDVGAGPGHSLKKRVNGGVVGIIIDARGRPTILPKDDEGRMKQLIDWFTSTEAYPESALEKWKG